MDKKLRSLLGWAMYPSKLIAMYKITRLSIIKLIAIKLGLSNLTYINILMMLIVISSARQWQRIAMAIVNLYKFDLLKNQPDSHISHCPLMWDRIQKKWFYNSLNS